LGRTRFDARQEIVLFAYSDRAAPEKLDLFLQLRAAG
jgi:hypothetical protein